MLFNKVLGENVSFILFKKKMKELFGQHNSFLGLRNNKMGAWDNLKKMGSLTVLEAQSQKSSCL